MRPVKWRLRTAACYGALAGLLVFAIQGGGWDGVGLPLELAQVHYLGEMIGSIIGGVIMFVLAALARNLFVR